MIQPLPVIEGRMAGMSPTCAVPSTVPMNSVPSTDSCTNRSPSPIWPRACITASRAQVPVPQGERSSRPGETTDGIARALLAAVQPQRTGEQGLVDGVDLGFSGCTAGTCSAAAALMRSPTATRSAPSSLVSAKPRDAGVDQRVDHAAICDVDVTVPRPATSTARSSAKTNAGTLSKVTLTHLPSRHCAVTGTRPAGASSTICVTGSRIGIIPVSSSAVTVQIVFVPDIGT